MSRKPTRKIQKRTADRLFSLYIRARDKRCKNCGKNSDLQCAHVLSRRYDMTRHDERNAVALCRGCHFFFTNRPLEWDLWCEENVPDYRELRKIALSGDKPDYDAILVWLKEATAA